MVLTPGESFLISPGIPHVVATLGDRPSRALVVASPSGFADLIEATATLNENEVTDMGLFGRIATEIGDEILGAPGDLP